MTLRTFSSMVKVKLSNLYEVNCSFPFKFELYDLRHRATKCFSILKIEI